MRQTCDASSLLTAAIVRPPRPLGQMLRESKSFNAACAFAAVVVSVGSTVEGNFLNATDLACPQVNIWSAEI